MSDLPPVRASDAEREVALTRLRTAAGEGRLTFDELAERLELALGAATRADLEPLTADLPGSGAAPAAPGTRRIFGIFGGDTRKGRWRIAAHCTVVNVFGGADLDLTEALLEDLVTEIRVFSLFGGSDILVPEGVHAQLDGFALFGGNDLKVEGERPGPVAPLVRVRAISIFGGTDVKTRGARPTRLRLGALPPPPPPPPPLPPGA